MESSMQKRLNKEGEEEAFMAMDLPEDMLVKILVRLPVDSLFRCRCVCKSWYSLISSPIFISAHLNHNAAAGESRTVIVRRRDLRTSEIRYTLHSNDDSLTEIEEFISPFANRTEFFRILGSVNGLICLLGDDYTLMLWNPAIRKSLILPSRNPGLTDQNAPLSGFGFGFGFDPLADDYKVVKVAFGSSQSCVEIYRLSTRSWSTMDLGGEGFILPRLYPRQAYLNGVVHWLAHDSTVVGFDMRTEKFRVMNLPGDFKGKRMEDIIIAAWCGLLSVFALDDSMNIGIWVMKEYEVVDSWTRQCEIPFNGIPRRIKGIGKDGKILLEDGLDSLHWFDPATKDFGNLTIRDSGVVNAFHIKSYAESLVMLDVNNERIGSGSQDGQGGTDVVRRNSMTGLR